MVNGTPRGGRSAETTGFLLSAAFVALASLRDVYLGGVLQQIHPLVVAVIAFSLCTVVFLGVALVRDRTGLAALWRQPAQLAAVNVTTALAWLSFFFALRSAEPALVQVLFFGIGPLSVAWLDARVTGTPAATLSPPERGLHAGLAGALLVAALVVLGGRSGLGPQPSSPALLGVVLALGGGTSIALSQLLCRRLNDVGVRPATLIALRFPGAVGLAVALAPLAGGEVVTGLAPATVAGVALATLVLIVLPNYVNQVGVALASPVTVRTVLAVGPALVFGLQALEGRLSPSPWTLAVSLLYAAVALTSAVVRHRAISAAPAAGAREPAPA